MTHMSRHDAHEQARYTVGIEAHLLSIMMSPKLHFICSSA